MPTTAETVLEALKDQIVDYFDSVSWEGAAVTIERNTALPEEIPAGGLVIIRDGVPGEPDQCLGQFGPVYYSHAVEIEIYVHDGSASARDSIWADIASGIGAALEDDKTLGGVAIGMIYGMPEALTTAVEGAEDIKSGVVRPVIDYETATPIA